MNKKYVCVAAIACTIVLMTAALGCGGSSATTAATTATTAATGTTSGATTTTGAAADQAAKTQAAVDAGLKDAAAAGPAVKAPTGKKIGFLLLSAQTEADLIIRDNLQEAAALFGFEVIVADWNFDTAKLQTYATTLMAQNPDLMIGDAADPSLTLEALNVAKQRGVPWLVTSAEQTPNDLVTAQYVPDERLNAKVLNEWLKAEIAKRFPDANPAKIAAFQAPPVGPGVRARDEQRAQDIAGTNIKEVVTHDLDLNDAVQDTIKMTRQIVAQYPDIAAFWQTADFCVPPIAQVLDSQGLKGAKRPIVSGFYTTRESRAGLLDGSIDGIVDINQGEMSWIIIDQAVEYWARGKAFADGANIQAVYSLPILHPWIAKKDNTDPNVDIVANSGSDYKTYFKTKWAKEFGIAVK